MKTPGKPFVDEVVDEMGDGSESDKFGADMEDKDSDPEGAKEDRIMAVKSLGKALGIQIADPERAAEALSAFVSTCS